MNEKLKSKLIALCLDGLYTDGAHHKQYYLEKILELLDPEEEVKQGIILAHAKDPEETSGLWEPGIG